MTRPMLGLLVGVLAAIAGVLVMLAGSDWPPPVGFVLVLVAACGALVGLAFAALGSGEPSSPPPGTAETALFVAVVAVASALGATVIATVAIALDRFRPAGPSPDGG